MWNIYNQIQKSDDIADIYNDFDQPISKKSGLADLITETGQNLNYDLDGAFDYFTFESNPNDAKDKINLKVITFEAYKRRLGNFILQQIMLNGNYDKTLKEFIRDVRDDEDYEQRYTNKEEEKYDENDISEDEVENEVENEEKVNEIENENSDDREEEKVNEIDSGDYNENSEDKEQANELDNEDSDDRYKEKKYSDSKTFKGEKISPKEKNKKNPSANPSELTFLLKKSNTVAFKDTSKDISRDKAERNAPIGRSFTKKLTGKDPPSDSSYLRSQKSLSSVNEKLAEKTKKKKTELIMNEIRPSDDEESVSSSKSIGLAKKVVDEMRGEVVFSLKQSKSNNSDEDDSQGRRTNKNKNSLSKNQKSENTEDLLKKHPKISKSDKSWFAELIKGKEQKLKEQFSAINENKEFIKANELPNLFNSVTSMLELPVHDHHRGAFKQIFEALHPLKIVQKPNKKAKTIYPNITYIDFIELMSLWGEKYSKEEEKVTGQLSKTIKEYQDLKLLYADIPQISGILETLEVSLQFYLVKFVDSHKEQTNNKDKHK